jgi:hypothetical protein
VLAARIDLKSGPPKLFERLLVAFDDERYMALFRAWLLGELQVQVDAFAPIPTRGEPHGATLDTRRDGDLLEPEQPVETDAIAEF